jgi:hypothetical protein
MYRARGRAPKERWPLQTDRVALVDAYFDELQDAFDEARRRRAASAAHGTMTRVEKSRYGGYRVRSLPAEFLVELMVEGMRLPADRSSPPL